VEVLNMTMMSRQQKKHVVKLNEPVIPEPTHHGSDQAE